MATTASGARILVENDDKAHPDQLYAEAAHAMIYAGDTAAVITMAGSAAVKVLGNTEATGADLAEGEAQGVTVDIDAGTFTVDKGGTYELWFNGRVEGEEDEDVTLEWQKGGTDLDVPHKTIIEIDAATGVSALGKIVSGRSYVDLAAGDVIGLGVLGSNSEVINFIRFNFGLRLIKSKTYEG